MRQRLASAGSFLGAKRAEKKLAGALDGIDQTLTAAFTAGTINELVAPRSSSSPSETPVAYTQGWQPDNEP
jgi:hypothetical protein